MKVSDLSSRFGYVAIHPGLGESPIVDAYTSDLLSDVMAKAGEESALVTIQAHKNTVAVASLVGARAVVICNDRPVPEDMVAAAAAEGIAIFKTDKSQFEVSGELYAELRARGR